MYFIDTFWDVSRIVQVFQLLTFDLLFFSKAIPKMTFSFKSVSNVEPKFSQFGQHEHEIYCYIYN